MSSTAACAYTIMVDHDHNEMVDTLQLYSQELEKNEESRLLRIYPCSLSDGRLKSSPDAKWPLLFELNENLLEIFHVEDKESGAASITSGPSQVLDFKHHLDIPGLPMCADATFSACSHYIIVLLWRPKGILTFRLTEGEWSFQSLSNLRSGGSLTLYILLKWVKYYVLVIFGAQRRG